jgi:hypothetical protein
MSKIPPEHTEVFYRRYGIVVRSTEEFEQVMFDKFGISPILIEGDDGELQGGYSRGQIDEAWERVMGKGGEIE